MIGLSAIGRIGLQSLRSAARGVRWDELFSGFPGVAYDFSAAGGMTQDRGGLTPVSAAAQSIGLAHDYARASSGWVSGTDRITNGVFDSDSWWSKGTNWTISAGAATHASGAESYLLSPFGTLVLQKIYRVSFDVVTLSGGNVIFAFGPGNFVTISAAGSYSFVMRALSDTRIGWSAASSVTVSLDNISVREITGNPLLAPTDARRPTWGAMANDLPCSVWTGDKAMATAAPVDFSSTDQITVMAAVRSLADATQIIAELSADSSTVNGSFAIYRFSTAEYRANSRGTVVRTATTGVFAQPDSAVLVFRGRVSTDTVEVLRNGGAPGVNVNDQGTGNYSGTQVLNIGARNAASPSLHFSGQIARIAAIGGDIGAEREAAMLGLIAAGFATS